MEIIIKRVIRNYKPAEIWRIEILSFFTIGKRPDEKMWLLTRYEPNEAIGKAIEDHLRELDRRKNARKN